MSACQELYVPKHFALAPRLGGEGRCAEALRLEVLIDQHCLAPRARAEAAVLDARQQGAVEKMQCLHQPLH